MDQTLLVAAQRNWWDQQNARVNRLLADLASKGLEVRAAAWLQTASDGQPYLYLVAPAAADTARRYETNAILREATITAGLKWINKSEVKLISPTERLAQALVEIADRYPDSEGVPYPFAGPDLNGVELTGPAFIYTPPRPAPAPGA